MKKIKRRFSLTEWLVLGLAGLIDFLQEIRDPMGIISNYYQTYYGYIPRRFQKKNLSHALWRALKKEKIKKFVKKGKVFYTLTPATKKEIRKDFLLLVERKKPWDRKWRLVIFDVEEKNKKRREFLRKSLKLMGFGMIQKSVWLSPYNFFKEIKSLVKNSHLEKEVILIETKHLYVGDYINLVNKVWRIDELNKRYQKILEEIKKISHLKNKGDRNQKLNEIRKEIIHIYLEDPHLPKELLPKNWFGESVVKKVKKLKIFSENY